MSKALTDGISKVIATVVAGVLLFFMVDVYLKREFDENKDQKGYDLLIGSADDDISKTPPDFKGALVHYKKAKEIANDLSDKSADVKKNQAGMEGNPAPEPDPIAEESAQTTNLNIEMIFVKGGTFMMGGKDDDAEFDENPIHAVSVPDFYIGKYEVTMQEFKVFVDSTHYQTDVEKAGGVGWRYDEREKSRSVNEYNYPVMYVTWNDAVKYAEWLSEQTGQSYRLPTESEWEFAARGGVKSKGYKYAGSDTLSTVGWFIGTAVRKIHAVGGRKPNEIGVYNMSGNVMEWCQDRYHGNYIDAPNDGSAWIADGTARVLRGGSWYTGAWLCRVSHRSMTLSSSCSSLIGFRLVRSSS